MNRGTKGLKSSSINRTGAIARKLSAPALKPARKSTLKSKELAVTALEKAMWTRLAALGCIACMKDGRFNDFVSIHHVDGRTKPGCHGKVLPLCAAHHQRDDTDPLHRIAIHPDKSRFERRYGTQAELMEECAQLLFEQRDAAAAPATTPPTLEHP